ncbi:hypothetical protein ES705_43051 [subsurface metagenome]
MPELRCKSIRLDKTYGLTDYEEIWSWAPERNIKIRGVSWSVDTPGTNGTMWLWLSKGAVGMVHPSPGPNEEEMIISLIHTRAEVAAGSQPGDKSMSTMFGGSDYMEVEDGEKLYLMGRGDDGKVVGVGLCIYYLG